MNKLKLSDVKYLKNPNLEIIKKDWKGNPFMKNRFRYPSDYELFKPEWQNFFKWMTEGNPQRKAKKNDKWHPPVFENMDYLNSKKDFIVWLGHASFLIQINGVQMITDPVFGKLPFVKRHVFLPFSPSEITGLDYLLISHDHRDHCDKKSIKTLLEHNQPKKILTALEISTVIKGWVGETQIEEAGWYQKFQTEDVEIIFLPTMHWCRRGLTDFNHTLWGSFIIRANGKTIYFGGDSGLGNHFEEIGQLFPEIDYAILGIGAYKPSYMMRKIHTSPDDATEAFLKLGAKNLIPMHYGTMDLSDEPTKEPFDRIQEVFDEKGMRERLVMLGINECFMA